MYNRTREVVNDGFGNLSNRVMQRITHYLGLIEIHKVYVLVYKRIQKTGQFVSIFKIPSTSWRQHQCLGGHFSRLKSPRG